MFTSLKLNYPIGKMLLLAALYFVTGKLGLMLAVPPGYATIIWPASGIALGMLLVCGPRLWPGILLGSFALNTSISASAGVDTSLNAISVASAFTIAVGSTLQALLGYGLIRRYIGIPIYFRQFRQLAILVLLITPIACLTAASIGVGSLYIFGLVQDAGWLTNWSTWWFGDVFGILVFTPVILMSPMARKKVFWRGAPFSTLPYISLLALMVPLGMTFYSWKLTSENTFEQGKTSFHALVVENEKALLHRLDSYNHAVLGGVGFFQGSQHVSRDEWNSYVSAVNVRENFPGINGIGWIKPVKDADMKKFTDEMRSDGAPDFTVHPKTENRPYYVIAYIEPVDINKQAVGLNIGFEDNRLQGAELARDSGKSAITKRIVLVQDAEKTAGFLLLHPMYRAGMATKNAEERREAFDGWIYAPFIANNFLKGLTKSQGDTLNIRIYDGEKADPEQLIYSSTGIESASARKSVFTVTKQLEVMQQKWLVEWTSTSAFERQARNDNALFVLVVGLLFSGMFATLLIIVSIRNTDTLRQITHHRKPILPFTIFTIVTIFSFALYSTLKEREISYVKGLVKDQSERLEELIYVQSIDKFLALKRMARRWESVNGSPQDQWRLDAQNYISHHPGLKVVEWVDSTYHVRWAEPLAGNENVIGMNILFDDARKRALEGAAERRMITLTPPLDLVQGYRAFITYVPLWNGDKFDGFIVGILNSHELFDQMIPSETLRKYGVLVSSEGKILFQNESAFGEVMTGWEVNAELKIYDKQWDLQIVPTKKFVSEHLTSLPLFLLMAGELIAVLIALTVHYILISRMKSASLAESKRLNDAILSSTDYFIVAIDTKGKVILFNDAAANELGYSASEVINSETPLLWHNPQQLEKRAVELSRQLNESVQPGVDLFTRTAGTEGLDIVEWDFVRRDGTSFPVSENITALKDKDGDVTGYLSVAENITNRKEMERMKDEFVSMVSHELRTPLTSIRASLGLIAGTMSSELPDKATRLIEIAYNNCERLILLINDILDIDKVTSGEMQFNIQAEPINSLINHAIETNLSYATKFNVNFHYEKPDTNWMINTDAGRFAQILTNLLSNAAKFSPEGGTVTIRANKHEESTIRVSVSDNGPGIEKEFHSKIFSKFAQQDSSIRRSKGGTGLGLHITRQLVEQMGGKIGFETEPGRGTTFWVQFPLAPAEN